MIKCMAVLLLAALGGCGSAPAANETAPAPREAAAPASPKPLKSEIVEAVFTGWDKGDYVWARLEVKGREPFGAWSGPSPIDLFLDSHVGRPLTLRLDTIVADVPEAGGKMELQQVADARIGALTTAGWWSSLSPKQRQDAQISLAGSLEPPPPAQ